MNRERVEIVSLGNGVTEKDLLVHDEHSVSPVLAFQLSRMHHPDFPTPLGVFRDVESRLYEDSLLNQIQASIKQRGAGTLEELFSSGDMWTVE
jgi:2-oxoglutarate ferredoxin oxidoreductase subunit beta